MPKIQMTCLKPMQYAGRRVQAGDQFEAYGESDARVLTAIGKAARYTPAPVVVIVPKIVPRAILTTTPRAHVPPLPLPPAPALTADETDDETKTKRQYRRRDLTADE